MRDHEGGGETKSVTVQEVRDTLTTEQAMTTVSSKESVTAEASLMSSARMASTMKPTTPVVATSESQDN